jgi:hypothetical protein
MTDLVEDLPIEPDAQEIPRDVQDYPIEARIDFCARQLIELTAKVDNLTNGVVATYQGVSNLVKMLEAVQQVAHMMPGGRKVMKAMMEAQNGTPNNG